MRLFVFSEFIIKEILSLENLALKHFPDRRLKVVKTSFFAASMSSVLKRIYPQDEHLNLTLSILAK